MNIAQTVSKNALSLFTGSAASQVLRILYVSLLARYIGVEGLGQISTATSLVPLVILIVNFGLDVLTVRDIAAAPERGARYVTNVLVIRLALTLIFFVVLAIILYLSPYQQETIIIIGLYSLTYVTDALAGVIRCAFYAFQKMEYTAAIDFTRDLLNVSVSVAGIYLGWSLIAIVSVSTFASLFRLVTAFIVMRWRIVRPALQIDLAMCRQIMRSALPFFVLVCISVASDALVIVILSWLGNEEAVGIYSAATIPIVALLMLPAMFMESIFPVFSQYFQTSASGLRQSYCIAYKVMLVIGFPLGVGTMLVSRDVLPLIFGEGFEKSLPVMNLLAIQLLTMVGYVNGAFMNATNRQSLFAILRLISLTLNASLCFLLIPPLSYWGAAFAVTVPALIDFILYTALCHHYNQLPVPALLLLKIALATGLMAGCSALALNSGVSVVLVVSLLAPAAYLLGLLIVHAVGAEEWRFFNQLVLVQRLRHALASMWTIG
jgi:O-antigen/teichoic acid export membrane protein